MVDVGRLKRDENLETKQRIIDQLSKEGYLDKVKASLRSEVIRVLEKEKKSAFGGASKYLKQSELATTVTKKVVSNEDGLLCAEIIREFLQFYQMEHSLHVFVPEMALGSDPSKGRSSIEREIGINDKDQSKPLLLLLIEQVKFGGGSSMPHQHQTSYSDGGRPSPPTGSKYSPEVPVKPQDSNTKDNNMSSPDPSSKKDNQRNTKKDIKKDKKPENQQNQPLSLLKDLPALGKGPAVVQKQSSGFDDFDFDDDQQQKSVIGNPNTKYSKAEQHLKEFYEEEKKGYKVPTQQQKFQVNVYGIPQANVELSENDISEEIDEEQFTDREQNYHQEPFTAITVSQSLGVDPSVDSLALDDYDHIEPVN